MPTALEPKLFDQVEEGLKDVVDPELGSTSSTSASSTTSRGMTRRMLSSSP